MKTIKMPSFGADMAKGQVARWNVKAGDPVKKGDIIASIETMKGLIDMEVFDDGVIEKLLIEEGIELAVGQPIAQLKLANEVLSESDPENIPELKQSLPIQKQNLAVEIKADISASTLSPMISPAARTRAHELKLDWRQLQSGNGPNGAIVLADIENLAGVAVKQISSTESIQNMREAIAGVVSQSKRDIPHYYLQLDMLLDKAQCWLTQHNQSLPLQKRILLNALVYCAISRVLATFSDFNGFYRDGRFEKVESVHLGNVINLRQGGIMVAAIHNAQQLGVAEMMDKLKDQVIRAKDGKLRMSELQDATVTVSNLGERGCDSIQSIIFPPQVAIIGIGRPRKVPWVVDEKLGIASIISVTLAADHRVSDGHSGARLLNKINSLLQKPESLV